MEGEPLPFQKLREGACTPTRDTEDSAGIDIKAPDPYIIKAGTTGTIPTGLAFDLPKGQYGRLATKSQQAHQYSLLVLGGVIDPGYTGEVFAILHVLGEEDFEVKQGDDFIQLIVERISTPKLKEVKTLTPSLKKLKQYTRTSPDFKKKPGSSGTFTKQAEISRKKVETPVKKYRLRGGRTRRQSIKTLCCCK